MSAPQEYIDFYNSLIPEGKKNAKWTIESFAQAVPLRYPGFSLKPGQEWQGTNAKYTFVCPNHGEFEIKADNFLIDNGIRGPGCRKCRIEASREAHRDKSRRLVSTTNADGVTALDIKFEWSKDRSSKAGGVESARLRCRCPHCGNEEWWVRANNFQKSGHSTHCGCQKSIRESINKHIRNQAYSVSPCMFYICPVYFDQFIKIGITNNFVRRATSHEVTYDGAYFVSKLMPRAFCFVAEQILLRETAQWQPEIPLPKEMIETYWPGSTELRHWELDPEAIEQRFKEIIADIETDGDWYRVYKQSFKKS